MSPGLSMCMHCTLDGTCFFALLHMQAMKSAGFSQVRPWRGRTGQHTLSNFKTKKGADSDGWPGARVEASEREGWAGWLVRPSTNDGRRERPRTRGSWDVERVGLARSEGPDRDSQRRRRPQLPGRHFTLVQCPPARNMSSWFESHQPTRVIGWSTSTYSSLSVPSPHGAWPV